jgi:hypothetical protein
MTKGRKTAAVLVCAGLMWLAAAGAGQEAAARTGDHHSQLKHVMNVVYRLAPHPNRISMDLRNGPPRSVGECRPGWNLTALIHYRNASHGTRDRVRVCRERRRWMPTRWTW